MRKLATFFGFFLLLVLAQHGAVVHELAHWRGSNDAAMRVAAGGSADTVCSQCPAFAQAASPALFHAFAMPNLVGVVALLTTAPKGPAPRISLLRPRNRGPPILR